MRVFELSDFGTGGLSIVERETPKPGVSEVLVKFHAASINFRDQMVIRGTYNPRMKLPIVPFSDGAGEIVEVGENVTRWQVGDRVCPIFVQDWIEGGVSAERSRSALGAGNGRDGVLREFGTFDENSLVRIPEHLSFEEAATLPCAGVTAWHALAVSGRLKAGESVLTLGTGGVSTFAIQFAKLFGARVIATSSSDEKLKIARELGADETVNYKVHEDWDKVVTDLTGGRGVDHVVEVGGTSTLQRSVRSVRTGGHIALIGALDMSGEFNPVPIFMRSIRVQGIFVGSRIMFEEMNAAIKISALRPVINKVFAFDQVIEALSYFESSAHVGKVVIKIS